MTGEARPWTRLGDLLAPLFSHLMKAIFASGPASARLAAALAKAEGRRRRDSAHGRSVEPVSEADRTGHVESYPRSRAAIVRTSLARVAQRFLSILSPAGAAGDRCYISCTKLGVLEKIDPRVHHARCLLQFNEYHKYTVDEHCLRAVERATEFAADRGSVGRNLSRHQAEAALHLALLIHDLGKGYPEDHSEVGLRIAENTARRLRLPPREAETLKFLVHKHLLMSHLAFRRDTSDDQLIVRFAVDVGSPEVLRMLLLFTLADLAAVGPGC